MEIFFSIISFLYQLNVQNYGEKLKKWKVKFAIVNVSQSVLNLMGFDNAYCFRLHCRTLFLPFWFQNDIKYGKIRMKRNTFIVVYYYWYFRGSSTTKPWYDSEFSIFRILSHQKHHFKMVHMSNMFFRIWNWRRNTWNEVNWYYMRHSWVS